MGITTALISKKAAHACTIAVEEVIVDHYQSQIDSYKGQQDALKKNAQLAKLTIYLSTDEIALPYAPSETFRPQIIFKLAVRGISMAEIKHQ